MCNLPVFRPALLLRSSCWLFAGKAGNVPPIRGVLRRKILSLHTPGFLLNAFGGHTNSAAAVPFIDGVDARHQLGITGSLIE